MGHQFAALAFTDEVKQVQLEQNSRANYAGMEQGEDYNHLLSEREAEFIEARDSFYMASVGETGWPYVQHRGGPAGFVRVLDEQTIGFADFSGNRQYISTGNFRNNDRVSIIFMDYPNRTRMKLLGRVSVVAESDVETLARLEVADYRATVERGLLIHVEAFDWNCPQHITPRYSEDHIQNLVEPLQTENRRLRDVVRQLEDGERSGSSEPATGEGSLPLVISGVRQLTPRIRSFELRSPDGAELPEFTAGAHLQVPVRLDSDEIVLRHYSITSVPEQRHHYEIAVLREDEGSGGSLAVHESYRLGQVLNCEPPLNKFELHNDSRPAILIAGGIGITPIRAMAQSLNTRNQEYTIHYAGRSQKEMAFRDQLKQQHGKRLFEYSSADKQRMDITAILTDAPADALIYVCGPGGLLSAVSRAGETLDIAVDRIRFERFATAIASDAKPVMVKLQRSDKQLQVRADQTILDAMLDAGVAAPYSCKTGICKTCVVTVLDGTPEHQDTVLTDAEKTDSKLMCPCVSRATTENLTLDI